MRRMYSKPQLLEAVEQEAEVNGFKAFENIVDKDGHKRFIEETFTPQTISGVEFTYSKWSLSGTHLLIVLAGNVANGTTLAGSQYWAYLPLPNWIKSKIVAMVGQFVSRVQVYFYDSSLSTQDSYFNLLKTSDNQIIIYKVGSNNISSDKTFRIAFDLLIDDE